MVFIGSHLVDKFLFFFRNLDHTVNLFLLALVSVFWSDSVVQVDNGSSQVAQNGGICRVNREFLDCGWDESVLEVLRDEVIGFIFETVFSEIILLKLGDFEEELIMGVRKGKKLGKIFDLNVGDIYFGDI